MKISLNKQTLHITHSVHQSITIRILQIDKIFYIPNITRVPTTHFFRITRTALSNDVPRYSTQSLSFQQKWSNYELPVPYGLLKFLATPVSIFQSYS